MSYPKTPVQQQAHAKSAQGMMALEEAVVLVLDEHEKKIVSKPLSQQHGLGAAKISRRSGLYEGRRDGSMNQGMANAVLERLHESGRVFKHPQKNTKGGWRLKP